MSKEAHRSLGDVYRVPFGPLGTIQSKTWPHAFGRQFEAFTPDNDPHGEHDFGTFAWKDVRYFWKIDYYDRTLTEASPDAADPLLTTRVLTIMRADEH